MGLDENKQIEKNTGKEIEKEINEFFNNEDNVKVLGEIIENDDILQQILVNDQSENNTDKQEKKDEKPGELNLETWQTETTQYKILESLEKELEDLENESKNLMEEIKKLSEENREEWLNKEKDYQRNALLIKRKIESKKNEIQEQKQKMQNEFDETKKAYNELPKNAEGEIDYNIIIESYNIAANFLLKQNQKAQNILYNRGTYEKDIGDFRWGNFLGKDIKLALENVSKEDEEKMAVIWGCNWISSENIEKKITEENQKINELKNNINKNNINVFLTEYKNLTGTNFSCQKIQSAKSKTENTKNLFSHITDTVTKPEKEIQGIADIYEAFGYRYIENIGLAKQNQMISQIIYDNQKNIEHKLFEMIPYVGAYIALTNEFKNNMINERGKKEETKREHCVKAITKTLIKEINPFKRIKDISIYCKSKKIVKQLNLLNPETFLGDLSNKGIDAGIDAGTKKGIERITEEIVNIFLPNREDKENPNRRLDLIIPYGRVILANKKSDKNNNGGNVGISS